MKYAISSCLMGVNCKYNGGNNVNKALIKRMKDKQVLLICPEVLGGLSVPRACCEIVGQSVLNTEANDVSMQFYKGASKALEEIIAFHADLVITQSRSPSCGKGIIYDGSFQKKLIEGNGIFVQMLIDKGFPVMDIQEFLESNS